MKTLLKIEELAMFGLSILLFSLTNFEWWWFLVLILTPDIGLLGYLWGNKAGAFTYNLLHHKAVAILLYFVGWYFSAEWVLLSGIIIFGHSSMDRIVGYGLKYKDSFHHTHLGWLKPPERNSTL